MINSNLIPLLLAVVTSSILSCAVFTRHADSKWQQDLEEKGHAEFYLDENNEKAWRLLPMKVEENK